MRGIGLSRPILSLLQKNIRKILNRDWVEALNIGEKQEAIVLNKDHFR
jgi:hypothetical protein